MTTHTLEKGRVEAFKADMMSLVESFIYNLAPVEDTSILMNEMPEDHQNTPLTGKQNKLLVELVHKKFLHNKGERTRWLEEIPTMSKFTASEAISSLLIGAR